MPAGDIEVSLPGQTSAVAEARRVAADWLAARGLAHLTDTAVLLVSEVVTNAVLYGGPPVRLRLTVLNGAVRVEVRDASSVLPVAKRYSETAATGRGLVLVQGLSNSWGTAADGAGKVVWFELEGPSDQVGDVEGRGERRERGPLDRSHGFGRARERAGESRPSEQAWSSLHGVADEAKDSVPGIRALDLASTA